MNPAEPTASRILEAAGHLFAEKGYGETSIQMVADAAQVNRALIFYYFHSKEELYRRLVELLCQAIAAELGSTASLQAPPEERLRAWIQGMCRAVAHHPGLLRILLREVVGPGHAMLPVRDYLESAEAPMREILEEGMAAGVFRQVDPGMAAISMLGLMLTFFRRRYANGQEFAPEAVAEHILSLTVEGLLVRPQQPIKRSTRRRSVSG